MRQYPQGWWCCHSVSHLSSILHPVLPLFSALFIPLSLSSTMFLHLALICILIMSVLTLCPCLYFALCINSVLSSPFILTFLFLSPSKISHPKRTSPSWYLTPRLPFPPPPIASRAHEIKNNDSLSFVPWKIFPFSHYADQNGSPVKITWFLLSRLSLLSGSDSWVEEQKEK